MDPKTSSQVLIRVLAKKPGWKDTNFQVNDFELKFWVIRVVLSLQKKSPGDGLQIKGKGVLVVHEGAKVADFGITL